MRAYEIWKGIRWAVFVAGLTLLGLVMFLDHLTGTDFAFSLFYLVPVLLISFHMGMRAGILFSVLAALAAFVSDNVLDHRVYSHPMAPYWDAVIHLSFFLLLSVTTAKLVSATERINQLLQLKTDMLSLVSHEFGNNLAVMVSALHLLKEADKEKPDPERQKLYGMLDRVYAVLRQTSDNFLDQIRMESGTFSLHLRPVAVREIAQNCIETLAPLAAQKGVELRQAFPERVIEVQADPDALALVLSNLLGNAIKYTSSGGTVTLRLEVPDPGKKLAVVSVEDTGIGIPEREQEAVFSGFYRTKEGRRAAKGVGIGLKVSRELIERHGLRLRLESAVGKGSRFFFEIPLAT